jgi:lysophospholipase L1-like esterase
MGLEGKTIACFGDSTTWGDNGTGKGGPASSWTSHMAELTDAAKVLNFGVKGSRIGVKADRDDSFVERFGEHDLTSDVICLFGGVNDFCRNVPVGAPEDKDVHTFYGALTWLVEQIAEKYPESILVGMTPCKTAGVPRKGLPAYNVANDLGFVEEDYADAFLDVMHRFGVPTIDLFRESTISPLLPAHRERYMPDGLHYSPAGYERLARRIAAGLAAIVG